jgi:UDPglucose 6-dehydrogenase
MNISIIGTGYVGLVTGTCFAEKGNKVICVDNDKSKLEKLNKGEIPIFEPGLSELVLKNFESKNLSFTNDLKFAVENSEIIFFCLPTPTLEDGTSDTKYIFDVSAEIGKHFNNPKIIVNKSTVLIGTSEQITEIINKTTNEKFTVASNPEFLKEGFAITDFMNPDRVVIGSDDLDTIQKLKNLYLDFVNDENKILLMDSRSSEMSKYAANSFLAMKISFINEIANLCEKLGANIDNVKNSIGMDARIGNKFLNPGIGFGGSCFPKDVTALKTTSENNGYNFEILDSILKVNDKQIDLFFQKINNLVNNQNLAKKVALWGLTFKPNTDDLRKSPTLQLIKKLLENNYIISAYDPQGNKPFKVFYPDFNIDLQDNMYDILEDKSLLIIANDWEEFKNCDLKIVEKKLANPIIIDGRNIFSLDNPDLQNFQYLSIGRGDEKITLLKL